MKKSKLCLLTLYPWGRLIDKSSDAIGSNNKLVVKLFIIFTDFYYKYVKKKIHTEMCTR